jgi:hypothetical protein
VFAVYRWAQTVLSRRGSALLFWSIATALEEWPTATTATVGWLSGRRDARLFELARVRSAAEVGTAARGRSMGQKQTKRSGAAAGSRHHVEMLRRQSGRCIETAVVALPDLRERIRIMSQAVSDNDPRTGFELEFALLEHRSATRSSKDLFQEAKKLSNIPLNRYNDVWPNDEHRVAISKGEDRESDYINASFVDSLWGHNSYIIAQGEEGISIAAKRVFEMLISVFLVVRADGGDGGRLLVDDMGAEGHRGGDGNAVARAGQGEVFPVLARQLWRRGALW